MNSKIDIKQQGDERCPGRSWQDLLDLEQVPVPDYLREQHNPEMGNDDLSVNRYISREYFELEKTRLWPKVWQMVCRTEDIAEPGDHVVYNIINDSVIVTRTANNEIKGFINSCLHRGRFLRDEGGCVNEFRCPFHGATWDLNGNFQGIPCQWDFKHFEEKDMRLPQVQVNTWGGFVFINFDPNAASLIEYLDVLPKHFERFPLDENYYKAVHVQRVMACNWKVGTEAFMESFHTVETHEQILTFTGDANSQYDCWGDNISRSVTPMGIHSPHLDGVTEEMTMRDIFKLSGRMALDSDEGINMPEGLTAREYVAQMNLEIFQEAAGETFEQPTMAELQDAILYSSFPNFQIWIGYHGNIVYRFIPNGDDPDSCIFDVMLLARYPRGTERPPAAPVQVIPADQPFASAEIIGALGPVFDQDDSNVRSVQLGMKASKKGAVSLATYQESRIRHLHQTLNKYING